MNYQVHLGFVDGNAGTPGNLRTGTQADERTLDPAGGGTAMREIVRLDVVSQNQAGAVRFDILENPAGAVAPHFLHLGLLLESFQQPPGDITLGDDAHQFAIWVYYWQPAKLGIDKHFQCIHQQVCSPDGNQLGGHVFGYRGVQIGLDEATDDVLNAENAYQVAIMEDRCAGDAHLA